MVLQSWMTSSLVRHFPLSPARPARPFECEAALNERVSFQVAFRMLQHGRIRAEVSAPGDLSVRVRRVGYVPLRHHNTLVPEDERDGLGLIPGYVPDPLFDECEAFFPQGETHAFWITVVPGPDARPGVHRVKVTLVQTDAKGKAARFAQTATIRLRDVAIEPRRGFHVTNWFYNDALLDYYRCKPFEARYWEVLPAYLGDVASHGQDIVYAPAFTPSLDGVKSPSQLVRVSRSGKDRYRFDWRDVKRYVDLARRCGVTHFEWSHFFTQWGARHAVRVYENQGADEKLLWAPDTAATSPVYRRFLAQFMPQFHRFLTAERLLDSSYFHVSDEPHGTEQQANYVAARALLKDVAPWMPVMDALSEVAYGEGQLTDLPIPSIQTALQFVEKGITCGCYYCCGPRGRYLNRLLDTPLAKIRMNGWLFYRWPFQLFLHWGYNYWYRSQTREMLDPYHVQDGMAFERGWAYGDPYMVYPGPNGPVDSMRWEVFADSLQDYALLQTMGIERNSPRLRALKSFEDFPKSEKWIADSRRMLLGGKR